MCIYLGYRLFERVQERQGKFELQGRGTKLKLSDVAPGIYFAAFGSCLLACAVFTKLNANASTPDAHGQTNQVGVAYERSGGGTQSDESLLANALDPAAHNSYEIMSDRVAFIKYVSQLNTLQTLLPADILDRIKGELRQIPDNDTHKAMLEKANSKTEILAFIRSCRAYLLATHIDQTAIETALASDYHGVDLQLPEEYRRLDDRQFQPGKLNGYLTLLVVRDLLSKDLEMSMLSRDPPTPIDFTRSLIEPVMKEDPFKSLFEKPLNKATLLLLVQAYIPYYYITYSIRIDPQNKPEKTTEKSQY